MPFNKQKHFEELVELRHYLHSIAEVSGSEKNTSDTIADFLEKTSPEYLQTNVAGNGIIATYEGQGEGPHILIRCELDALPIPDVNDVKYRSKTEGIGHKCGHDGHMAILCGLGVELGEEAPDIGKVSLLFQPAEETGKGAKQVLKDQKFRKLNPDFCFALHNLPGFKKHQIIVRDNVFAAASVGLSAKLKGHSAHAAHPEQGVSPALAVAHLIQSFSSIPQFYSSLEQAVKVTIVGVRMGEPAFGISPSQAELMATLRTYDEDVLATIKDKCMQVLEGTTETYGLRMDSEWVEPFPVTINTLDCSEIVKSAAHNLDLEIYEKPSPFGWSEDFGHYTREIKGAMFGLGIGEEHPALHAEDYVIPTAISMFMEIINEVIGRQ
jgi:amidohydrolase